MNINARILMILCLLSASFATPAATVSRMYEVSLPVINQARDIRQSAFEQGFAEVLVRVSGNSQVLAQVDISRAASFVQQYRYQPLQPPVATAGTAPTSPPPSHTLWIEFNEGAVTKLLRDNHLPVWGKRRPNVLIWLAVRDGRNRYVLKDSDVSVIKDLANREASRRGLPLYWPKYDARDQQALGFADIWGGFWDPVVQASKRYSADGILLGRMDWTGSNWTLDWSLWLEQRADQWQLSAVELEQLMASGLDLATDHIASRFAVQQGGTDEGKLLVQVNGVEGVAGYARIARYFQSLASVRHVYVTQVEQDQVRFHLNIAGSLDDLQRLIALDKSLVPDLAPIPTAQPPVDPNGGTDQSLPSLAVLYYKLSR